MFSNKNTEMEQRLKELKVSSKTLSAVRKDAFDNAPVTVLI